MRITKTKGNLKNFKSTQQTTPVWRIKISNNGRSKREKPLDLCNFAERHFLVLILIQCVIRAYLLINIYLHWKIKKTHTSYSKKWSCQQVYVLTSRTYTSRTSNFFRIKKRFTVKQKKNNSPNLSFQAVVNVEMFVRSDLSFFLFFFF